MVNKLSNWFLKISTGPLTLACLVIFLVFTATILPDQNAKAESYSREVGSPDTSLFYSASDLYRFAQAYGSAGRTAYIQARFTFDLIFPLVYTTFLVAAISYLMKHSNLIDLPWARLNLLPIAGMIFDYLENISAAIIMARYPQTIAVIDHLAGIFTLLKWIFIAGSFIALVIVAVLALVRWFKKTPQHY